MYNHLINMETKKDIKQIIRSIFICGNNMNDINDLSEELCNEYLNQIIEVLQMDTLDTVTYP